jgi:hypothetical protein
LKDDIIISTVLRKVIMQNRSIVIVLLAALVFCASGAAYQPSPSDIAHPKGLPALGKWMIAPSNKPANWLGLKFQGKEMREPINVIIIDSRSKTSEEAMDRLSEYCSEAGFKARKGHSSGYFGYIEGSLYPQIPRKNRLAFSNKPPEFQNDHGRIFGPYKSGGKFYFTAAFSREKLTRHGHEYVSFVKAREEFTSQMSVKTDLKVIDNVFMDNKISSEALTTGDHDGYAIVLRN